jgi:hypothetical protein
MIENAESITESSWPTNRGFASTPEKEVLSTGTRIDRYGDPTGTFASPKGAPFETRSLPKDTISKPYHIYEVKKPIEVDSGTAA